MAEIVRAGAAGEGIQAQRQGIQMVLLFPSSVFAASSDRGHDREGEENVSGTYQRFSTRRNGNTEGFTIEGAGTKTCLGNGPVE